MKKNERTPEDQALLTELNAIADQIVELSQAMKAINGTRLRRRALLILLKDATGVSMEVINRILEALPLLAKTYVN